MPDATVKLDSKQLNSIKDLMQEKFPEFIEEMLENLQGHMEEILYALGQKDINTIEKSAHSVGSNSSYIGAMDVHDLARKIEHIAEDLAETGATDISAITPLVKKLQDEILGLKTALDKETQTP